MEDKVTTHSSLHLAKDAAIRFGLSSFSDKKYFMHAIYEAHKENLVERDYEHPDDMMWKLTLKGAIIAASTELTPEFA